MRNEKGEDAQEKEGEDAEKEVDSSVSFHKIGGFTSFCCGGGGGERGEGEEAVVEPNGDGDVDMGKFFGSNPQIVFLLVGETEEILMAECK
ncbi:hypothetical protein L6452_19664 [Arctium lappa]|uniref:Uncharacterized protein n=1 Tax=Arctium lappa TaxID=4217 RepID=A0ACB9BDL6_ARCLA|nr:hypothetical protein L6452_19664 [Arctium lappa]